MSNESNCPYQGFESETEARLWLAKWENTGVVRKINLIKMVYYRFPMAVVWICAVLPHAESDRKFHRFGGDSIVMRALLEGMELVKNDDLHLAPDVPSRWQYEASKWFWEPIQSFCNNRFRSINPTLPPSPDQLSGAGYDQIRHYFPHTAQVISMLAIDVFELEVDATWPVPAELSPKYSCLGVYLKSGHEILRIREIFLNVKLMLGDDLEKFNEWMEIPNRGGYKNEKKAVGFLPADIEGGSDKDKLRVNSALKILYISHQVNKIFEEMAPSSWVPVTRHEADEEEEAEDGEGADGKGRKGKKDKNGKRGDAGAQALTVAKMSATFIEAVPPILATIVPGIGAVKEGRKGIPSFVKPDDAGLGADEDDSEEETVSMDGQRDGDEDDEEGAAESGDEERYKKGPGSVIASPTESDIAAFQEPADADESMRPDLPPGKSKSAVKRFGGGVRKKASTLWQGMKDKKDVERARDQGEQDEDEDMDVEEREREKKTKKQTAGGRKDRAVNKQKDRKSLVVREAAAAAASKRAEQEKGRMSKRGGRSTPAKSRRKSLAPPLSPMELDETPGSRSPSPDILALGGGQMEEEV